MPALPMPPNLASLDCYPVIPATVFGCMMHEALATKDKSVKYLFYEFVYFYFFVGVLS
jgi:hypothetical protein